MMRYRTDTLVDTRTSGQTDIRTHRQMLATTIPGGQSWPRVKMKVILDAIVKWVYGGHFELALSRWNTE